MSNGFQLAGFDELIGRLREMGDQGKEIEEKALKKGAEIMRNTIEDAVPISERRAEHGKNHIVVGEIKDGVIPIGPSKEHYYLRFPEFGTSKQPAQGFIERSFKDSREDSKQAMADVISEELRL